VQGRPAAGILRCSTGPVETGAPGIRWLTRWSTWSDGAARGRGFASLPR